MKLEDQVVSLELAKKLKELGVKQESLFYWTDGMRYDGGYDLLYLHAPKVKEGGGNIDTLSAFTVTELGKMLPTELNKKEWETLDNCLWVLKIPPGGYVDRPEFWIVSYQACDLMMAESTRATTEADARAKMLIYLIENELINLKSLTA